MRAKVISICTVLVMFFTLHASATTRYVDLNCTNATPPFADWNTAGPSNKFSVN